MCNACAVNAQAQRLAHPHVLQAGQCGVELDDHRARQRDGCDAHLGMAAQPPQAGRVQPIGQVRLAAFHHQRPGFGPAGCKVGHAAHRWGGCGCGAVIVVKRLGLHLLRWHQLANAVGAGANDALHLAVRPQTAGCQHQRAVVGQLRRQRVVRAAQADEHLAVALCRNGRNGRIAEQGRGLLGALQALHHHGRRCVAAIMKPRTGPQRKVPGQPIGRHLPPLGQCGLGAACVIRAQQGFAHLQVQQHVAAAGRGQAGEFPRAHDLQRGGRRVWRSTLGRALCQRPGRSPPSQGRRGGLQRRTAGQAGGRRGWRKAFFQNKPP